MRRFRRGLDQGPQRPRAAPPRPRLGGSRGLRQGRGPGTNIYSRPKPTKGDKPAPADGPVTSPDQVDDGSGDRLDADAAARARANAKAAATAGLIKGRPLLGSVNVRKYDEITVGGRRYWKINRADDEYLPATSIKEHTPSTYRGARLGDDTGLTLPIAFVWPRGGALKAWTRGAAKGGGTRRQLGQRDAGADPRGARGQRQGDGVPHRRRRVDRRLGGAGVQAGAAAGGREGRRALDRHRSRQPDPGRVRGRPAGLRDDGVDGNEGRRRPRPGSIACGSRQPRPT